MKTKIQKRFCEIAYRVDMAPVNYAGKVDLAYRALKDNLKKLKGTVSDLDYAKNVIGMDFMFAAANKLQIDLKKKRSK